MSPGVSGRIFSKLYSTQHLENMMGPEMRGPLWSLHSQVHKRTLE